MTIPESQLETWSHQGSITQSKNTYATIKRALENTNSEYTDRNFYVFLQGSYGNDTNIFNESDVDVVICYDGAFFYDFAENFLPDQQKAFMESLPDGTYTPYDTFKEQVRAALETAFGRSVKPGKKAIKIEADGSRRNADVVVAFDYHYYYKFNAAAAPNFVPGISFFTSNNTRIDNYPKQHSENCTTKHQATGNKFKPIVRIFKNMRNKLIDDGLIGREVAPSYFIEGLLYNVPDNNFSGSYHNMVFNILNWLYLTTDRTEFVCANEQHYLLRNDFPVCWPMANGEEFINKVITLWNNW